MASNGNKAAKHPVTKGMVIGQGKVPAVPPPPKRPAPQPSDSKK